MRTFEQAGRVLGALEERIMEIVWRSSAPVAVREVGKKLKSRPPLAYTTVMTTLDRLYKKGFLSREKVGNAFVYSAAMSKDEYKKRIVEETLGVLLAESADPVLAAFVDTAASVDEDNLVRLERLIAAHRRTRR